MTDPLDQMLRAHFRETADYRGDDDFTRQVMQQLPASPAHPPRWRRWLRLGLGTGLLTALGIKLWPGFDWQVLVGVWQGVSLSQVLVAGAAFSAALFAVALGWLLREMLG